MPSLVGVLAPSHRDFKDMFHNMYVVAAHPDAIRRTPGSSIQVHDTTFHHIAGPRDMRGWRFDYYIKLPGYTNAWRNEMDREEMELHLRLHLREAQKSPHEVG